LWEEASRFEDRPSMAALAYPPHITLAVYDRLDHDCLRSALTTSFEGTSALRVTFDRIGWFDGMPLVLWASPKPCDALARTHMIVHGAIDPKLCRPHYRPGAWVPHCTLATNVSASRRDDALAFARHAIAPFDVLFDGADAVAFPPVAVIQSYGLTPRPPS
jgi:2'-5' RNA ligase